MSMNKERVVGGELGFVELMSSAVMQPSALTASFTVGKDMPSVLVLDAVTTANRKVIMPAAADIEGKVWLIRNIAGATGTLQVRDAADANTLMTVGVNGAAIAGYMNGVWRSFVNAVPSA